MRVLSSRPGRWAVLAVLVVSGCAPTGLSPAAVAQISSVPSAPVVPSASPSPSPSPTVDPEAVRKAAGLAYLSAAKAINDGGNALAKSYKVFGTLTRARAFYNALAALDGAFIQALRKITWPPDTASDAHALVAQAASTQALELEAGAAQTWADVASADAALQKADRAAGAAANLVRADLGLPPIQF